MSVLLSSILTPIEGIRHKEENTTVDINGEMLNLKGTLFITESVVTWQSVEGRGFTLYYPDICLHAVSRDVNSYPRECLFCMVDGKLTGSPDVQEEDEEENEEEANITEVRFIPDNKNSLDAMYKSMCDCQALHPDEQDVDSDAEAESEAMYYEGEEGLEHLTPEGQNTLARLEGLLITGSGDARTVPNGNAVEDEGQFDDADEDMQDQ